MEINPDPSSDDLESGTEGLCALNYGAWMLVHSMIQRGPTDGPQKVQFPKGDGRVGVGIVEITKQETTIELPTEGVTVTLTPTSALDNG
jgi:hypothetical protein